MRPVSLGVLRLRWLLVLAAGPAACVPSYDFAGGDGGLADGGSPRPPDGGAPAADGSAGDATSDVPVASPDGPAASDAGVDAPVGPQALGPMAIMDAYVAGFCAVRGGQLFCWGDVGANQYGTLGFADTDGGAAFPTPLLSPTVGTPGSIGIGAKHACSLYGRSLYCRGDNAVYQLGNASAQTGPAEVVVTNLENGVDAIGVALFASCAIVGQDAGPAGNVYCWGANGEGELGRPFGDNHPPGAWPVTGELDGGATAVISDAVAIAAGGLHVCAVTRRGTVVCWGSTQFYESGPNAGTVPCPSAAVPRCSDQPQEITLPNGELATAVVAGDYHTCALAGATGSVYCWGLDGDDILGAGTPPPSQTCLDDESPPMPQPCSSAPLKVVGLPAITALRAGGVDTCALDAQGHAYCWGANDQGQLGAGDDQVHQAPVEVLDIKTSSPIVFDDVTVGFMRTCGRSGTALYCWGVPPLGTQAEDGAVPDSYWAQPVQF